MKAFLALAVLFSLSHADIEVTELFRAETPAELEAALVDGYPMPWLAEVLADSSIPEEDRYWLDCRMRAAIAIDLQTFFDEDGDPRVYDADWIMPGEHYWRETFVLSPDGDQLVTHPVETGGELRGEIGRLVDCHGELIGETALTARGFVSSRDGSIWVSSLCRVNGDYRLVLLYSDGSYFVSPVEMEYGLCGVSQSGDYVVLAAWGDNGSDRPEGIQSRVILMNKNGSIIWETELEMIPVGNSAPVISPNDDYCAVITQASSIEDRLDLLLQVFDMGTGLEAWRLENPYNHSSYFSSDGQLLTLPGNRRIIALRYAPIQNETWADRRYRQMLLRSVDSVPATIERRVILFWSDMAFRSIVARRMVRFSID